MAAIHVDDPALAALGHIEGKDRQDEKVPPGYEVSAHAQDDEDDDAHAGLEFPTDEERATLRRVADSLPWNSYRRPLRFSFHHSSLILLLQLSPL